MQRVLIVAAAAAGARRFCSSPAKRKTITVTCNASLSPRVRTLGPKLPRVKVGAKEKVRVRVGVKENGGDEEIHHGCCRVPIVVCIAVYFPAR